MEIVRNFLIDKIKEKHIVDLILNKYLINIHSFVPKRINGVSISINRVKRISLSSIIGLDYSRIYTFRFIYISTFNKLKIISINFTSPNDGGFLLDVSLFCSMNDIYLFSKTALSNKQTKTLFLYLYNKFPYKIENSGYNSHSNIEFNKLFKQIEHGFIDKFMHDLE